MSDDIEWVESDGKWTIAEAESVPISDAVLYDTIECREYGSEISLYEFYPDPDGPSWYGECPDCELLYRASPTHVRLSVSDSSL